MPRISLLQACFAFDPQDPEGRARRRHMRAAVLAFFFTYLMLSWMGGANAQGFDALIGVMDTQSHTWLEDLSAKGRTAFLALAGIEISWCALLWTFDKDNFQGMVGDLVKSVMTISFFYAIMINAPTWIPIIHDQFRGVAADSVLKASSLALNGQATALTVDGVIARGIEAALYIQINLINPLNIWANGATQMIVLVKEIIAMGGTLGVGGDPGAAMVAIAMTLLWGFTSWAIAGLVSICVLICYLIIALQLIMLQVEMGLLMAAGAVFLGLGGSKWTRDYVNKYLNHALVTGFRYLVLMMVLSVTLGGADAAPWEATKNAFVALGGTEEQQAAQSAMMSSFGILFLVLVKTFLAIKAPELAGALFSGGAALSAGAVSGTVMGAVGAATTAMGMPGGIVSAAEGMGTLARGELGAHAKGEYKGQTKSERASERAEDKAKSNDSESSRSKDSVPPTL